MKQTRSEQMPDADQLAEVWGDTVSRRQVGAAVAIACALSVSAYQVSLLVVVPLVEDSAVGRGLAMIGGVLGSLLSGLICSVFFPPKRIVLMGEPGASGRQIEALEQLAREDRGLGTLAKLPPAVFEEMHQVGLIEVFRGFEMTPRAARERPR